LRDYLREINATPLLSPAEEREWADRVARGDSVARDHMVRANLRLVVSIARGYLGKGLPLEDLVAEGNLGLMRAVEGYDGSHEVRFSTYASYWIKQSIRAAVQKQGRFVRLPAYVLTLLGRWRRASAALADRLGRAPTPEEVGRALQLSTRRLRIAGEAIRAAELTPCMDDDEGAGLGYAFADDRGVAPDAKVTHAEAVDRLRGRIARLESRAASVLSLRFGLGAEPPLTLREVGERLDLTRERVRQLEKQALRELAETYLPDERLELGA
jgi:RNA polymerase primary sigma factor